MSDNQPLNNEQTPAAAVLFDADAQQRVPFQIEFEGELYEIAYKIDPVSDEQTTELETRRNVRQAEADADEARGRDGMVAESDSLDASDWLFKQLAKGVEGTEFDDDGDWMENFSQRERAAVIDQAVLACQVLDLSKVKAGKRLPAKRTGSGSTTVLRVLFGGRQIDTRHVLAEGDGDIQSEFDALMRRGVIVAGTKLGQREIYIPNRARRLGEFYDRLKLSAEGYAGRIPLHHKMAVVIHHLGRTQQALTKN